MEQCWFRRATVTVVGLLSLTLAVPVSAAWRAPARLSAAPLAGTSAPTYSGAVADPTGDTFGFGLNLDVTALRACFGAAGVTVTVDFAGPISPGDAGNANDVVGFIDIDTDQNAATGAFPDTDVFSGLASGLGVEYFVSLFDYDSSTGTAPVFRTIDFQVTGSATVTFAAQSFTAVIPIAAIGGDDGRVNLATVIGTHAEPTDVAPNGGNVQTEPCACTADADCDDGSTCTTDHCDATAGCTYAAANEGNACGEDTACTSGATCRAGACVGITVSCDDQNPCTDDSCDPRTGCQHVANNDFCGDVCSFGFCANGQCAATPRDCSDGDPCTVDQCDPFFGCTSSPGPKSLPGDDGGCIPPDAATAKCENGMSKAIAKLAGVLGRCHIQAALAQQKGKRFDEEACELKAQAKFTAAVSGLSGCPPCALPPQLIAPVVEADIDGANGAVACAPGTPFGDGDDTGFVPADPSVVPCELGVGKNVLKLVGKLFGCHIKGASLALAKRPFDEQACETIVKAEYQQANVKLTGCPACLDAPGLADYVEQIVDSSGRLIYCASPAGAFLD